MQLALWDHPALDLFALALDEVTAGTSVEAERQPARTCLELVQDGLVDLALVPTVDLLHDPSEFDVLPAVALSSWAYPFARIELEEGMTHKAAKLAVPPDSGWETLVARIVLREHYGIEPEVTVVTDPSDLAAHRAKTKLDVTNEALTRETNSVMLDLGQEWYELASYPLVWGLFVARKGTSQPRMIRLLRRTAEHAEERRAAWLGEQRLSPEAEAFQRDSLRFRLDDVAIAGLTELRQFLFFYRITDDVPNLNFVALPDEEDGGKQRKPLL